MRRSIVRAAFNASAAQLFNPANRIIGQEGDLFSRMANAVRLEERCPLQHTSYHDGSPAIQNIPDVLLQLPAGGRLLLGTLRHGAQCRIISTLTCCDVLRRVP